MTISAIYLHGPLDEATLPERHRLRRRYKDIKVMEVRPGILRITVHHLLNRDILLVPDAVERCTPELETVKGIARLMGLDVLPLGVYLARIDKQTMPAAVAAEPQPQQIAACGHQYQTT